MAKTTKKKAGKKAAIDPNFQTMLETKRKLRTIDRSYKEIGRIVSRVTALRGRLDRQLRHFATATLERLSREDSEPFNQAPTNH